jgi:hypothetical protein
MEGPKLRFNRASGGTANMGFTKKISLVTHQAIKAISRDGLCLTGDACHCTVDVQQHGLFTYSEHQKLLIDTQRRLAESELNKAGGESKDDTAI